MNEKLRAISKILYYTSNYYGQYWHQARLGMLEVFYLWRTIEWDD